MFLSEVGNSRWTEPASNLKSSEAGDLGGSAEALPAPGRLPDRFLFSLASRLVSQVAVSLGNLGDLSCAVLLAAAVEFMAELSRFRGDIVANGSYRGEDGVDGEDGRRAAPGEVLWLPGELGLPW